MVVGGYYMNYLHVIEVINKMEHKVIQSKLITYTSKYNQKEV